MDDPSPPTDLTHAPFDANVVQHQPPRPSEQIIAAVSRLAPTTDMTTMLKQAALPAAKIESARQVLGDQVVAWVVEETCRTVQVIDGYYPDVPDLPMPEIARATEATLLQICQSLLGQPGAEDFVDEYRGFSRDAARRGTHVRLIVDVMRVVQQRWVGSFLTALGGPPTPHDLQEILTVTAHVFDAVVDTFLGEYLGAREQLMAGQLAWRRGLVQALIAGDPVEPDLIRSQLGTDIGHHHLAMILWFPGMAAGYELERVAKQAAAEFPDATLLSMPIEDGQMWAWISCATAPPQAAVRRLAALRPSVPGVRMAVGPSAAGAEGFRRTHLQALDAAVTARTSHSSTAVSSWETVGLVTLLGRDLERARWYVLALLGPLSHDDALAAEQRATLRSYLETNQSLVQTAAAQHVHRNTVVYRIRKIEEALGHPIAERRTDLYCAVLLADYFGSRVLRN
jgi:DNA-binding PucR family transcriptional regulator